DGGRGKEDGKPEGEQEFHVGGSFRVWRARGVSNLAEVVAIEFLDRVRLVVCDTHTVVDHVIRKLVTVDQNDAVMCLGGCFCRARREAAAGNKHAFGGLVLAERTDE